MEQQEIMQQAKDIWNKTSEHISHYLDLKEGIMESEFVQVVGDSVKFVGFVRNTTALIMQKRFESFLKGFNPTQQPTEKQMQKLIDYIDDESKAEFIADTFSKIMLAQSSEACLLMGTILNTMVENKETLAHDDLICVQALSNFFNYDIKNYRFIYEFITRVGKDGKARTSSILEGKIFNEAVLNEGLDKKSLLLTVEKAVTYQLLMKYNVVEVDIPDETPSIGSSADVDEYYKANNPGVLLHSHILKCSLYN
ncbi:hypothetical protein PAT3040_04991 [Paenibacillus agaridevorans]|uniref:Uncharacterized protein n=1 Tax=Paenibacillus agaridevorans TaxID=171404 RepID=A0A2R5EX80_9BACL|nr:hypothetical protein [Paenibacillus agaridevorans]GBG10269.1 hypothetical protein PAT3040_04991 [Paenibacillus agaridevorans]